MENPTTAEGWINQILGDQGTPPANPVTLNTPSKLSTLMQNIHQITVRNTEMQTILDEINTRVTTLMSERATCRSALLDAQTRIQSLESQVQSLSPRAVGADGEPTDPTVDIHDEHFASQREVELQQQLEEERARVQVLIRQLQFIDQTLTRANNELEGTLNPQDSNNNTLEKLRRIQNVLTETDQAPEQQGGKRKSRKGKKVKKVKKGKKSEKSKKVKKSRKSKGGWQIKTKTKSRRSLHHRKSKKH